MKVFHDWEFQETGAALTPISVGMVREDGAELYLINGEYPIHEYLKNDPTNAWLRENVLPHLPIRQTLGTRIGDDGTLADGLEWNESHPDYECVLSLANIRDRVQRFLLGPGEELELWGWYSAYDHVCLARLWGTMANLPVGVPMYTNDLRQFAHMLGVKPNSQHDNKHHPLDDAHWNRDTFASLVDYVHVNVGPPQRLAGGVRDGMTSGGL